MSITFTVPLQFAVGFATILFAWIIYLLFSLRNTVNPPSLLRSLCLFFHLWPAVTLTLAAILAQYVHDQAIVWLGTLLFFRYYKTVIGVFYWFRYKPAVASSKFNLTNKDCTVIVPTVGPEGNPSFSSMVSGILANQPAHLIFSTNTEASKLAVEEFVRNDGPILTSLQEGTSAYQKEHFLSPLKNFTEIQVTNVGVSNKREQTVAGFSSVETPIIGMADDTAIWPPTLLAATLPAFEKEKVAFVGTKKWVSLLPRVSSANLFDFDFRNWWSDYWAGLWNMMGGIYLIRHNFEIRSSNAADGGVFCVSGRTHFIRTSVVKDSEFQNAFLNEYIQPFPQFLLKLFPNLPKFGPLKADDDNFITRWVINHSLDIKIQYSDEATMTTVLSTWPRFSQQCQRWSRTTIRQNPIAIFYDQTIWWKWPITVWTTYFPWLWNAALFWDAGMVYVFTRTGLYQHNSSYDPTRMMAGFIAFIYATKLIKTMPWFWKHPSHFLLYFFPIPAYLVLVYCHSLLKVYTIATFYKTEWSGRNLPTEDEAVEKRTDKVEVEGREEKERTPLL